MTVLFQFAIVIISIFIFSTTHATDRSSDTAVLDVDASGEVDALTEGPFYPANRSHSCYRLCNV